MPRSSRNANPWGLRPGGTPLVGRGDEREQLRRWLDEAIGGDPRIVVIGGDAGIGKSRLVSDLLVHAAGRGCTVLGGRCHEDEDVPYLAVATALRSLAADSELTTGPDRDLVELLIGSPATAPGVPAAEDHGLRHQLTLYLSVATLVLRAARRQPVVLSVEDIHWADPATTGLLGHLVDSIAREAAVERLPLVVVLTVRSGDERSGDAGLLASVRREPAARELLVPPLDEVETHELVTVVAGGSPSPELRSAVVEATGGNPFLIQLLMDHLGRSGVLDVHDGVLEAVSSQVDLRVPVSVDRYLADRVDALDEDALHLLTLGAFSGDDGDLSTLFELADHVGLDGPAIAADAEDAGLISVTEPRYRFTHPLIRQHLYHRPLVRERRTIHRRLADYLSQRADASFNAMPIAFHLRMAGAPATDPAVRRFVLDAAHEAFAVAAWRDAARYFDLAIAGAADAPPADLALLHYRAARAFLCDFDTTRGMPHAVAAASLAREVRDLDLWSRVTDLALQADATVGATSDAPNADVTAAAAFLREAGDECPIGRARVLARLSAVAFTRGDFDDARRDGQAAFELAQDGADPDVARAASFGLGLAALGELDLRGARRSFEDARSWAQRIDLESPHVVSATNRLALVALLEGDTERVLELTDEAIELARRWHSWAEEALAGACHVCALVARGEFDAARPLSRRAAALVRRSSFGWAADLLFPAMARLHVLVGEVDEAHGALDEWEALGGRGVRRYRALVDAMAGDPTAARRHQARPRARSGRPVTFLSAPGIAADVALGILLDDPQLVQSRIDDLDALVGRGVEVINPWGMSVTRLMAEAHSLLGNGDESTGWFDAAEAFCRENGLLTELALTLASRRGDQGHGAEAVQLLDGLGMLRSAEDVTIDLPGSIRVVLFTDLTSSTEWNVRLGDADYVEQLSRHDNVVRRRIAEHGGVEVKHTGDGFCAWFATATAALRCSLDVERDMDAFDMPFQVRCGVAAGEPIGRGSDIFGLVVVAAKRLCDLADPGQVLVTGEVGQLTRGKEFTFEPCGARELKGFPDPVEVYVARSQTNALTSRTERKGHA